VYERKRVIERVCEIERKTASEITRQRERQSELEYKYKEEREQIQRRNETDKIDRKNQRRRGRKILRELAKIDRTRKKKV
jgi:hypothetical protein